MDLGRVDPDESHPLLPVRQPHDDGIPVDDPSHRGGQENRRRGRRRTGILIGGTREGADPDPEAHERGELSRPPAQ
jgi:hypothetical protein